MKWPPPARPRSTCASTRWSRSPTRCSGTNTSCKNVARKFGKTVTFMPKPLFADNGSGMHTHQSLWKGGKPLFAGEEYGGLSKNGACGTSADPQARQGDLRVSNPTMNSYKRLGPRLRGAREPGVLQPKPIRLDPDPDVLRLAEGETPRVPHAGPVVQRVPLLRGPAHGRAGRRPEQNRSGQPLDKDIYALSPEELSVVPTTPGSLEESLKALATTTISC